MTRRMNLNTITRLLLLPIPCAAILSSTAHGGGFDVFWHTIDCGGATYSTGGGFILGGTIGQHDAGPVMSGGGFFVSGGFWPGSASGGTCVGDLDGDGQVLASDLAILLGQWGGPGSGDLDGSGTVDAADLGALLGAWGPCLP
ncbi:MAG: hypothetical protein SGJ09_12385 [Phycisphaerae bacterium]|nr:hypothetical protein [Phycisphaerae bacterium]